MIASETSTAEAIDEKVGDVIAYMLIIKGMLYSRINHNPNYPDYEGVSDNLWSTSESLHDKLIYTLKSE
jgi:hypothetical protein